MKTQRQSAIVDILNKNRIKTQEELCLALKNHGFNVTQATVSRDVKEMQLHRIADHDGYHYTIPEPQPVRKVNERRRRMFQDLVAHIDYSENIIVLKTLPGAAQSVASVIDSLGHEQILGTVAGDDTILVIVKQKRQILQVLKEFQDMISK